MNETMRLSSRNALIQAMLSDSEGIKNYYRFTDRIDSKCE